MTAELALTLQSVHQMPLSDIPHLERPVFAGRQKIVASGVHANATHRARVSRVVVNELVRAGVPHFDCAISTCAGDAAAIRKEQHLVHYVGMVIERVQFSVCRHVPQLDELVIATGDGLCGTGAEVCRADPVGVSNEGASKLAGGQGPNLGGLVVRASDEVLGVGGEFYGAHCASVAFECHGFAFAVCCRRGEGRWEGVW